MACCGEKGNKTSVTVPRVRSLVQKEPTPQQIEKEIIVRYRTPKKVIEKTIKKDISVDDDSDEMDATTGDEYTFRCYENQDHNDGKKLEPDVAGSGYVGPSCPLICLLDEVDKREKAQVMKDLKTYQQKRRKLVLTASMVYHDAKK